MQVIILCQVLTLINLPDIDWKYIYIYVGWNLYVNNILDLPIVSMFG